MIVLSILHHLFISIHWGKSNQTRIKTSTSLVSGDFKPLPPDRSNPGVSVVLSRAAGGGGGGDHGGDHGGGGGSRGTTGLVSTISSPTLPLPLPPLSSDRSSHDR